MAFTAFFTASQPNVQLQQSGTAQPSAPAQGPAPAAPPPGGQWQMLLPFLILIPFLFLSFRRQKKEQEARANLKKGDRVVTTGGLIGELVELDGNVAKVKIAPGTTVQVLPSNVSSYATPADKSLADLKDAKAAETKK